MNIIYNSLRFVGDVVFTIETDVCLTSGGNYAIVARIVNVHSVHNNQSIKDENGGDKQDLELKETKKELLSLLDLANRDKSVQVISKISTGGEKVGRRIASVLTTSFEIGLALVLEGEPLTRCKACFQVCV